MAAAAMTAAIFICRSGPANFHEKAVKREFLFTWFFMLNARR